MTSDQANAKVLTKKVLSNIYDIAYHPVLNVYQLTVSWHGSQQTQSIFLPETILFRGLEESLKIEQSYQESSLEQSCSFQSEQNLPHQENEGNSEVIWKNETRPQREMREMVQRNMLIFEETIKEED